MNIQILSEFQNTVIAYYKKHKRDLPWRNTTNPYHILVSEVMLQQTQVSRVLQKYDGFVSQFPDFRALADSSLESLLTSWQGLGYNRRALYLKRIAEIVAVQYKGLLPKNKTVLKSLPGIGEATACSIIVFSRNIPLVFIETNIRRVFIHFFEALLEPMSSEAIFRLRGRRPRDEHEQRRIHDKQLLPLIESSLDFKNPREWYFALMDYGAMLGKTVQNPNKKSFHYHKQSKFEGSMRQVRGKILRALTQKKYLSEKELQKSLFAPKSFLEKAISELKQEGFIHVNNQRIQIKQ